ARRTASTTCRCRPTPLTAPAPRNRADARRTRPGGAGAGAAGRGAAGAVAAGRRPARAGRVDGGGAPGGLCATAAGGGRVRDPHRGLRRPGLLSPLRGRELQLAAALVLPLHRGVGCARRLAAAVGADPGAVDRCGGALLA